MLKEFYNKDLDVSVLIAIDNTTRGPALGGCRFIQYESIQIAREDVLRLAKTMTFKNVAADLNYGGGKSVIYNHSQQNITYSIKKEILKFFAECVASLDGEYITTVDSGTTVYDMELVSKYTKFVTGYNNQTVQFLDPSYFTSVGVISAIKTAYKILSIPIKGSKVLIKGIGSVGLYIVKYLIKSGADVYLIEINQDKAKKYSKEYSIKIIFPDEITKHKFDLFCPCDIGPSVTNKNINLIDTKIIAGATNNQIESKHLSYKLKEKGVLYCPDYIINSGGVISIASVYENPEITLRSIAERLSYIPSLLEYILKISELNNWSSERAADFFIQKKQEALSYQDNV